jgi:hypothetical protein
LSRQLANGNHAGYQECFTGHVTSFMRYGGSQEPLTSLS